MKSNVAYQATRTSNEEKDFLSFGNSLQLFPTITRENTPTTTPVKGKNVVAMASSSPRTPSLPPSSSRSPTNPNKNTVLAKTFINNNKFGNKATPMNQPTTFLTGVLTTADVKTVPHYDGDKERHRTIFKFNFIDDEGNVITCECWSSDVDLNKDPTEYNKVNQCYENAKKTDDTIECGNAMVVIKCASSVRAKAADPKYDAPAKVKLYINNSKDIWFKPMPYKDTFFVKMHGDPRLWAEQVNEDVDDIFS